MEKKQWVKPELKRVTNYVKLWEQMQKEADALGYGDALRALGPDAGIST